MLTPSKQLAQPQPLPKLLPVQEVQARLDTIFPSEFPDRALLVGIMSARVIFVFLYGGFVEGNDRYLRPSHVYLFTEDQAQRTSDSDRLAWLAECSKPGYRTPGNRWYADTSRESIRDDLMRNHLLRLEVVQKLPGVPTTASTPINYLSADFAALFDPSLNDEPLDAVIGAWRARNLNQATQQRMALRAQGVQTKAGDVLIEMPDGSRIRVAAGQSTQIAKGLIEDFSKHHLESPVVLWLSASDKKAYPQFVEISAAVGLVFDLGAELPDMILADMKDAIRFLFCEIVATDGAVTDARKQALLTLVRSSNIPEGSVEFLTAFDDRESSAFRKNFSKLAVDSLVWFRTEPDLIVKLSTANRVALDLQE